MPAFDVTRAVEQWFSRPGRDLALWYDGIPVRLQRRTGGYFGVAQITLTISLSAALLQWAALLTRPSLAKFGIACAALCLDPASGGLCLISRLDDDSTAGALALLESLVDQCEIWQNVLQSTIASHPDVASE